MIRNNKQNHMLKNIYYILFTFIILIAIALEIVKLIYKKDSISVCLSFLNEDNCYFFYVFDNILFYITKPFIFIIYTYCLISLFLKSYTMLETFTILFKIMVGIKFFNITITGIQPLILKCSKLDSTQKTVYFFFDTFLIFYFYLLCYTVIISFFLKKTKLEFFENDEYIIVNNNDNISINN